MANKMALPGGGVAAAHPANMTTMPGGYDLQQLQMKVRIKILFIQFLILKL